MTVFFFVTGGGVCVSLPTYVLSIEIVVVTLLHSWRVNRGMLLGGSSGKPHLLHPLIDIPEHPVWVPTRPRGC